jgi:hypothetical protein
MAHIGGGDPTWKPTLTEAHWFNTRLGKSGHRKSAMQCSIVLLLGRTGSVVFSGCAGRTDPLAST